MRRKRWLLPRLHLLWSPQLNLLKHPNLLHLKFFPDWNNSASKLLAERNSDLTCYKPSPELVE
jgi:hypothetical protein